MEIRRSKNLTIDEPMWQVDIQGTQHELLQLRGAIDDALSRRRPWFEEFESRETGDTFWLYIVPED